MDSYSAKKKERKKRKNKKRRKYEPFFFTRSLWSLITRSHRYLLFWKSEMQKLNIANSCLIWLILFIKWASETADRTTKERKLVIILKSYSHLMRTRKQFLMFQWLIRNIKHFILTRWNKKSSNLNHFRQYIPDFWAEHNEHL